MILNKKLKQIISYYFSTVFSLVFSLGISIFVTRLLGPERYGDYKFFQMVITLFFTLFTFGYFNSITRIIAHTDGQTSIRQIMGVGLLLAIIIGIITWLLLLIFSTFQGQLFGNSLNTVFRGLGFFVIIFIIFNYLSTTLLGSNHIFLISILKVLPQIIFISYLYFAKTLSTNEAIVMFYCSMLVAVILVLFAVKPKILNVQSLWGKIRTENKNFGFKVYTGRVSNVASAQLGALLLGLFISNKVLGFYALSVMISTPLMLIPTIVGSTFFRDFAKQQEINRKIILLTSLICVVSYVTFFFLIEPVVNHFYSEDYATVINFARIIGIGSVMHGIGDLYNRFLYAKGRGNTLRNGTMVVGVFNVAGYFTLIKFIGVNGALIVNLMAGLLYFTIMFIGYKRYIKN